MCVKGIQSVEKRLWRCGHFTIFFRDKSLSGGSKIDCFWLISFSEWQKNHLWMQENVAKIDAKEKNLTPGEKFETFFRELFILDFAASIKQLFQTFVLQMTECSLKPSFSCSKIMLVMSSFPTTNSCHSENGSQDLFCESGIQQFRTLSTIPENPVYLGIGKYTSDSSQSCPNCRAPSCKDSYCSANGARSLEAEMNHNLPDFKDQFCSLPPIREYEYFDGQGQGSDLFDFSHATSHSHLAMEWSMLCQDCTDCWTGTGKNAYWVLVLLWS